MLIEIWEYTSNNTFVRRKWVNFEPTAVGESGTISGGGGYGDDLTLSFVCTAYQQIPGTASTWDGKPYVDRTISISESWSSDPVCAIYAGSQGDQTTPGSAPSPDDTEVYDGQYDDGNRPGDSWNGEDGYWYRLQQIRFSKWYPRPGAVSLTESTHPVSATGGGPVNPPLRYYRLFIIRLSRRYEYMIPSGIVSGAPSPAVEVDIGNEKTWPTAYVPGANYIPVQLSSALPIIDGNRAFTGWQVVNARRPYAFIDNNPANQTVAGSRIWGDETAPRHKRGEIVNISFAGDTGVVYTPFVYFLPMNRATTGLLMRDGAGRLIRGGSTSRLVYDR